MSGIIRRVGAICLVCAAGCGVIGTTEAVASGESVTAAIHAQDKAIKGSATYQDVQHFHASTVAQAKALIPKFAQLKSTLEHGASVVSGASATGSAQEQGQKDWVDGVREVAAGVGSFETGIKDLVAGNKTAAKTAVVKAEKLIKAGNLLSGKGDKLLGLPTRD